ncbi:MAG TPA: non-homologous end-joining DNA ligase [Candidatus Limnocylindria bacterium]|nr:non-homologous end-joining DNA ligase [Candidatus Limnocylindria bacterium]
MTRKAAAPLVKNAEKVWWPDEGITKGDVAAFYESVGALLTPWLRDRPLVAERCPDGVAGFCFYQKNFPPGSQPRELPRLKLPATSRKKDVHYLVGTDTRAAVALVGLGCIALHVFNVRRDDLQHPDWLAFDLDPTSTEFADAARAGLGLRKILDGAKLRSYPKTSGSRGLHVFVPLERTNNQEDVRGYAMRVGEELAARMPDLVTVQFSIAKRGQRVFADAARNALTQTIVSPYTVRRRPKAPVSTPLSWDEVTPRLDPSRFNIRTFRRLRKTDPWRDFWHKPQALPKA